MVVFIEKLFNQKYQELYCFGGYKDKLNPYSLITEEEFKEYLYNKSNELTLDVVKRWVENGGCVDCKDSRYGWTALITASYEGKLDIVKYLIYKGADINKKNEFGITALIVASQNGCTEIKNYLESLN